MSQIQEQLRDFQRPTNPKDLYIFLFLATGENIPAARICPDHQTPWEFCQAAFFDKYPSIMAIGPRGGTKTRTIAKLITAQLYFLDGVEIANVGAIEKQAKKCYRYVADFLDRSCPQRLVKSLRSETRLDNGSMYEQLVGTVSGVNSPHPTKLFVDEVELMRPEVLEELMMVPTTNKMMGIPSSLVLTSTRKYSFGTVQGLLDNKAGGFQPFIWCYKEVAENCGVERRGSKPKKFVIKDYMDLDEAYQPKEKEITAWSNCGKCPLLPTCKGSLARAAGFYSIDDLIRVFTRTNIETWVQQMECRKTSTLGRVYPTYDEAVHKGDYPYNANLPIDVCMDYGFSEPAAVGFWQEDEDTGDVFRIGEIYESGLTTGALAARIKKALKQWKLEWDDVRYGIGDSEQAQQIADLQEYGIYVEAMKKGTIQAGLNIVRGYMRTSDGKILLHVDNSCEHFNREAQGYRYKLGPDGKPTEVPVDKNNHTLDEARYYLTYLATHGAPNILVI